MHNSNNKVTLFILLIVALLGAISSLGVMFFVDEVNAGGPSITRYTINLNIHHEFKG